MTSNDVNRFICANTKIDFEELSSLFTESVKNMSIDKRLVTLAKKLTLNRVKVAIVTDNMDVFSSITIKNHNLDKVFPVIVNSCEYGVLKSEANGKLFDITLDKLGVNNYKNALLIDDSSKSRSMFESKGGKRGTGGKKGRGRGLKELGKLRKTSKPRVFP